MKKIISILLAVMLVVSFSTGIFGAVEYNPSGSYTVTNDTPTCEEAIKACNNGELGAVQHIYFQLPAVVPGNEENTTWTNVYNSTDLGLDYCQVCVYWWNGIAGAAKSWPSGAGCTWVGYRTKLVDAESRIYEATVPADGNTPVIIWNNGVNAGMDETQPIFKYGRQIADANIEGAYEGDYDTLPEGSPNEENMDGCIQIINYDPSLIQKNPLTGFDAYGSDWYIYYGDGCYGKYIKDGEEYTKRGGRLGCCCNPEHSHIRGDVNGDTVCDVYDVLSIQYHLAYGSKLPEGITYKNSSADVDEDGYVSIIDATRIQRFIAKLCNIDGTKPYKDDYDKNPPRG